MALNLNGLEPGKAREYVWVGDEAVDLAASDVVGWLDDGRALALKADAQPTVFRVQPLTPTRLQLVYNHALMGAERTPGAESADLEGLAMRNMPAVYRAAVAYGVTAIDNGPQVKRVADAGGMRLADALLDALDRFTAKLPTGESVRLVSHLGALVLADSQPTDGEKKA